MEYTPSLVFVIIAGAIFSIAIKQAYKSFILRSHSMVTFDHTRTTATPGDAQSSVNDYHMQRATDQAIATLTQALSDLDRMPWRVEEIVNVDKRTQFLGKDNQGVLVSGVNLMAMLLSKMSVPPAAAGKQQGLAGSGAMRYVSMGPTKVRCQSDEAYRELTTTLNARYFSALLPARKSILEALAAYQPGTEFAQEKWGWAVTIDGGQGLLLPSEAEGKAFAEVLNAQYRSLTASIRQDMVTRIGLWAGQELSSIVHMERVAAEVLAEEQQGKADAAQAPEG
jgi:hypothetical protein